VFLTCYWRFGKAFGFLDDVSWHPLHPTVGLVGWLRG
jgi:hypothetical protein